MYKLLTINGYQLPDPEGSYSLNIDADVNEYKTEDGSRYIEVIRERVASSSVSFKGLTAEQVETICSKITTVSTVKIYDATLDTAREIEAYISKVKTDKVTHRNGLSVWKLSFNIEEL